MRSSVAISQPGIQLRDSVSSKRKIIESMLCAMHCARSLGHCSEQRGADLCLHGISVLLGKTSLGWGLAKAGRRAGS